jgi:hypothetical protein
LLTFFFEAPDSHRAACNSRATVTVSSREIKAWREGSMPEGARYSYTARVIAASSATPLASVVAAASISLSVVKRPKLMRIELCASSIVRP